METKEPKLEPKLIIRVSEEERAKLWEAVKARDTTLSQMIRDALDLYLSFPPKLLKGIKVDAGELKHPVSITIAYLFAAYTAMTSAMTEQGIPTPIFKYAFRHTDNGKLMDLNEMGKLTFRETQAKIKKLKETATRREKKRVKVDSETKGIMSYAL